MEGVQIIFSNWGLPNSRWFLHAKNELKQEGRTTSIENVMEKN